MRNDWQQTSVLAAAAFERINQHAQYYPPDNSRFYQYTRELGILKEIIKQITIQLSIKIEMAYNKENPRKRRRRNNKLINAQQIVEK